MEIAITVTNEPVIIAVSAALLGVFAHLLKKCMATVGTYNALKRYIRMHFTTVLFSGIMAFGFAIQTVAGYDPESQTVFDLASIAFGKAFIGDSVMEIQRKKEEQRE